MSFGEHIDYFKIFTLKKKSGRYDNFKVQYWRERPGRQNGKFSLVLSLNCSPETTFDSGSQFAYVQIVQTKYMFTRNKQIHLNLGLLLSCEPTALVI